VEVKGFGDFGVRVLEEEEGDLTSSSLEEKRERKGFK